MRLRQIGKELEAIDNKALPAAQWETIFRHKKMTHIIKPLTNQFFLIFTL